MKQKSENEGIGLFLSLSKGLVVCLFSCQINLVSADFSAQQIFHYDSSATANSKPFAGLNNEEQDRFALGRSFFHVPWVEAPSATTARDGLGPLFNANSCVSCHRNNGGGAAVDYDGEVDRSIVIKLSTGSSDRQAYKGDPVYGPQIAINGNHDIPFEARVSVQGFDRKYFYQDGEEVILVKPEFILEELHYGPLSGQTTLNALRAPALFGLGLIEQIPEQQIILNEDENDADGDGISGRSNRVWSWEDQTYQLGRFGWKATTPSVIEQTAHAFNDDMGLTSEWFKTDNCGVQQAECLTAYQSSQLDVPMDRIEAVSFYLKHLRMPRNHPEEKQGKQLLEGIGCTQCHRNGYQIQGGITINPYSDFLLHDMGEELSAKTSMFNALPSEWRTPPLWGLGLHKTLNPRAGYLHDGRAKNIEQAILWHAGEAENSRKAFSQLSRAQRLQLIRFLETL